MDCLYCTAPALFRVKSKQGQTWVPACKKHASLRTEAMGRGNYDLEALPSEGDRYDKSWDSIEFAQWAIKQWADLNFPERTAHSALCKLMLHEIPEFAMSQKDPLEYADLLILIFDIATLNKIDIPKALYDKMQINYARQWNWDPVTGMAQHKKGDDNGS